MGFTQPQFHLIDFFSSSDVWTNLLITYLREPHELYRSLVSLITFFGLWWIFSDSGNVLRNLSSKIRSSWRPSSQRDWISNPNYSLLQKSEFISTTLNKNKQNPQAIFPQFCAICSHFLNWKSKVSRIPRHSATNPVKGEHEKENSNLKKDSVLLLLLQIQLSSKRSVHPGNTIANLVDMEGSTEPGTTSQSSPNKCGLVECCLKNNWFLEQKSTGTWIWLTELGFKG